MIFMTHSSILSLLLSRWRVWALLGFAGLVFALVVTLFIPRAYSSTVRVLITQPNVTGLDPYTATKSTERIASTLSELVYTTTFFDNTLAQAKAFDATFFPTDERDRRKAWRKTIETATTPGTGIMTVTAYHPDRAQAQVLVDAATRELAVEAPNFFGYSARVQVIDSPLPSRWFARPAYLMDALFGLLLGLFVGVAWVLGSPKGMMRE